MMEYWVYLKRHKGQTRPDVCIFRDEDRKKAINEMKKYVKQNGFAIQEKNGRFTIADIVLVEREPAYGAPIISETPYHQIIEEGCET